LSAATEAVGLATQVTAAEAAVTVAASSAQAAVTRAAEVHRARIAGIAGELAAQLVPGQPCAVCGGVEHPAPAARDPEHTAAQDADTAGQERADAERALAGASPRLTTVRGRLGAGRSAGGGVDPDAARADLAALLAGGAAAERAGTRRRGLEVELSRFEAAT